MFWRVDCFNTSKESVGFSFCGFVKLFASLWKAKDRREKIICPLCRVTFNRMIKSQEQDEFIAVRVQDPRVQNEGSWNSYVDFKIFLHTNSKAFTAKTSCVRRRYSEFVWLKKKLQKNAGLVPVPDLPQKSFFSFINDEFIERRRKGLQSFLDKVLHMTVCLSDSQLHLFLQTQLPVKHIEDCVQGHTPYTVTEAILNYASSNRGWVQEEEEGGAQEIWTAPVPYESVESPAPHLPSLKCAGATLSGPEPPNELADVSVLESRLNDTEQTADDVKKGSDQEQMVEEEEGSIKLMVEVHQDISVLTEPGGDSGGTEATQRLDEQVKDLRGDGEEYSVSQIDGPIEIKPLLGDLDGLDKAVDQEMSVGRDVDEITSVIEKKTPEGQKGHQEAALEQEYTVRQSSPDKDVPEEYPITRLEYNEVTLDLNAAQEDDAEQSDHTGKELVETADKTVTLDEGTSISEENLPDAEDQEQAEAEVTEKEASQENESTDEDTSTETDIQEDGVETSHSEISETHLSCSERHEDPVGEVKKTSAMSVHISSAILILEGIEEVSTMQTAPVAESEQKVSTDLSNDDRNFNANTADVNTLVLEAIEID